MNPSLVGDRSEACVVAALLKASKTVLQPWGNAQRYDLAIDNGDGTIVRVQCKTAWMSSNKTVLKFNTCSYSTGKYGRKDYAGQIEMFAVYSPDLDKVYLVPVQDAATTGMVLRLTPCRNGQSKGVKLATVYELKMPE